LSISLSFSGFVVPSRTAARAQVLLRVVIVKDEERFHVQQFLLHQIQHPILHSVAVSTHSLTVLRVECMRQSEAPRVTYSQSVNAGGRGHLTDQPLPIPDSACNGFGAVARQILNFDGTLNAILFRYTEWNCNTFCRRKETELICGKYDSPEIGFFHQ
jgi:hypothetical protein